jgi:hypothetical protein
VTRKKLPELFIERCSQCPYMQLSASDDITGVVAGIGTRISAVCRLGMFDKRVESANLFYFTAESQDVLKELREGGFGSGIPDWCPLEDWYPKT